MQFEIIVRNKKKKKEKKVKPTICTAVDPNAARL